MNLVAFVLDRSMLSLSNDGLRHDVHGKVDGRDAKARKDIGKHARRARGVSATHHAWPMDRIKMGI